MKKNKALEVVVMAIAVCKQGADRDKERQDNGRIFHLFFLNLSKDCLKRKARVVRRIQACKRRVVWGDERIAHMVAAAQN